MPNTGFRHVHNSVKICGAAIEISFIALSIAPPDRASLPANAISGSSIQNSHRWRVVFEFSARNVGPNVYTELYVDICTRKELSASHAAVETFQEEEMTCLIAHAIISAYNCPETVRYIGALKKLYLSVCETAPPLV